MRMTRRCGTTIKVPVEITDEFENLLDVNTLVIEPMFSTGFNGQFSIVPTITIPNQDTERGRFYVVIEAEQTAGLFGTVYDLDIRVTNADGYTDMLQKVSIELSK